MEYPNPPNTCTELSAASNAARVDTYLAIAEILSASVLRSRSLLLWSYISFLSAAWYTSHLEASRLEDIFATCLCTSWCLPIGFPCCILEVALSFTWLRQSSMTPRHPEAI